MKTQYDGSVSAKEGMKLAIQNGMPDNSCTESKDAECTDINVDSQDVSTQINGQAVQALNLNYDINLGHGDRDIAANMALKLTNHIDSTSGFKVPLSAAGFGETAQYLASTYTEAGTYSQGDILFGSICGNAVTGAATRRHCVTYHAVADFTHGSSTTPGSSSITMP